MGFVGFFYVQMGTIWVHNLTLKHKNVSEDITSSLYPTSQKNFLCYFPYAYYTGLKIVVMCDKMTAMEPTTGGGSLPSQWTGFPEYIGREVAPMTAYEIISIFIGILALLMSFGSLVIALLAFLDKRNKRK